MAKQTPNPHPSRTVWTIIGLVVFLVCAIGYLAFGDTSFSFFHYSATGGKLPAMFVGIAVIVGVLCVGLFVHRSSHS